MVDVADDGGDAFDLARVVREVCELGREAVLFLVAIKEALEDPARLLLDL